MNYHNLCALVYICGYDDVYIYDLCCLETLKRVAVASNVTVHIHQ